MTFGVVEVRVAVVEAFDGQGVFPRQTLVADAGVELGQVVDGGGVVVIGLEGHLITVFRQLPPLETVVGGADVVPGRRQVGLDEQGVLEIGQRLLQIIGDHGLHPEVAEIQGAGGAVIHL